MEGCRGDPKELERKVWDGIHRNRKDPPADPDSVSLPEEIERLRAEANALAQAADRLEDHAKTLRELAQDLFTEAAGLEQAHKERERRRVRPPEPDIRGAVTEVDVKNDRYVIDRGKEHGVRPGRQLIVFRGNQYVATIEIKKVEAKQSEGIVLKGLTKSPIQVGDEVTTGE